MPWPQGAGSLDRCRTTFELKEGIEPSISRLQGGCAHQPHHSSVAGLSAPILETCASAGEGSPDQRGTSGYRDSNPVGLVPNQAR